MNLIKEFFKEDEPHKKIESVAAKDAEFGQDHADAFFIATNGGEPAINTEKSLQDALAVEGADSTQLTKWVTDLRTVEDQLVTHLPAWILIGLLALVGIAEYESAILFWKGRGVTSVARIVAASASAIVTCFFPWLLTDIVNRLRRELPSPDSKNTETKE